MALVLARGRFRGKWLLDTVIDLPFAISPVVVGLSLVLVYGLTGWFGKDLADAGIQVIFSTPGIVLATVFVTLPFVVREVTPVLREIGYDQEQAATTLGANSWQTFWKITLPANGSPTASSTMRPSAASSGMRLARWRMRPSSGSFSMPSSRPRSGSSRNAAT